MATLHAISSRPTGGSRGKPARKKHDELLQKLRKALPPPPDGWLHKDDLEVDLTHPLGSGAFADVFFATREEDSEFEECLAVKKVRWSTLSGEKQIRKICSEVEIWKKLTLEHPHRNILPLRGYFINETVSPPTVDFVSPYMCYTSMTLFDENDEDGEGDECDGPWPKTASMAHTYISLLEEERGARRGGIETLDIVKGIAAGLEHLHDQKITHCDLKCNNILISANGEPLLCDFGISRHKEALLTMTRNVGTANWVAPELISSDDGSGSPNFMSDMWSFAMVVYELLDPKGTIRKRDFLPNEFLEKPKFTGTPGKGEYFDQLWDICDTMCSSPWTCRCFDPQRRPTASDMVGYLKEL